MKWRGRRQSSNVEDLRGRSGGGGGGGLKIGGIGGLVIIIIALFFGVDPRAFLQGGPAPSSSPSPSGPAPSRPAAEDETAAFIRTVLADTEDVWNQQFAQSGRTYKEPVLTLFTDSVRSACGFAQSAMGPFYCPAGQKVYIDLGFFDDMKRRLGAPGDFAQAYVVAHEVGHHIQTLLGISQDVHQRRRQMSETEGNRLAVRLELQADCLAGVWGHHAQRMNNILEPGDIEEALNAASAIGDDRLQKQSRGYVTPESFTHGTSEQRVRWFKTGFSSGDSEQCDTFAAGRL